MIRVPTLVPAVLTLAVALLAAGCGDSNGDPGAGGKKPVEGAGQPAGPEVKVDMATVGSI